MIERAAGPASPLAGAFNFRDLGGLPTTGGRVIRSGRLFRSDTLQALTAKDAEHLATRLGLKAIIDLRLAREVAEEGRGPLAARAGISYLKAPLEMASTTSIDPDRVLHDLYAQCLERGEMLALALERLAQFAGQPTVVHCAAGKDRTGVLTALVLRLTGVADEVIVGDYMASATHMPRMLARFASWPTYRDHLAAMPPQVYAVEEAPMRHFLEQLDKRFGGAQAWAFANGVSEASVSRIRAGLLETD